MSKYVCLVICLGLGLPIHASAGGKNFASVEDSTKRATEEEVTNEGLQQTLDLNFSPENREKLRKALDAYAKSSDQDHDQIEARRRAMQTSIETRFFEADNDGDGTVDRQEATEKLPQVARQFSQIDANEDNVISLDELVEMQARIQERRKAAETMLEIQKLQAAESIINSNNKSKIKQSANRTKKRTI